MVLHEHLRLSIDEVVSSLPKDSLIAIDRDDRYKLRPRISRTAGDEWQEMVHIARTSYALSRKWIDVPYEHVNALIASPAKRGEFKDVTNRIFHDAVESVARLWLKAWQRFMD